MRWRRRYGWRGRALAVAAGLLLDRALGEPPVRWHPVAWFGTAMGHVERRLWADSRPAGVAHAATGVVLGGLVGVVSPLPLVTAVAVAGRSLRTAGTRVEQHLLAGDLDAARADLSWLVGRDPSALDASGVSAAVVESLAENLVDAVVAPALWGLALGGPGVAVHRCVNTLDAMVGHHSERYEAYGWASARLDDALAWLPARATVVLVALVTPGRAGAVVRLVRRDAAAHPSPNAGRAETAAAAALGLELGGPLRYGSRSEDRPRLGDGPRPVAGDITRARRLVDRAELALVAVLLLAAATPRRTR